MSKHILIIAGEPSGDLHASNLVREIKKSLPESTFFGLGGRLMAGAGVLVLYDIADLALVGLSEVLEKIFIIRNVYRSILREIDEKTRPDLAILVDYPGFNLRIARELKRRGIPIIYYISPQVWAWGKDRVEIIKNTVEKMLVFFKFEEELYKKRGVPVEFVGHPLGEVAKPSLAREAVLKKYSLDPAKKTIALLPGSRRMEVENLLSVMLESARRVQDAIPETQFIISRFPGLDDTLYKEKIRGPRLSAALIEDDTYHIAAASDFAIVASGTATLETALIGTPMVVIYKTSLLTWISFKLFSRLTHIGIVNIIAGKKVVPEFLQFDATPKNISRKVIELMRAPEKLRAMKDEFAAIKSSLGPAGSSGRAAKVVLSYLR